MNASGKAAAARRNALGDFGEDRALQLLQREGFVVEKMPKNFPFFDLMAKKADRKVLVPVKARNKFTAKGKIKKNTYNLYTKKGHLESAEKIANFFGADLSWIAVTVDTKAKTYSAYMGDLRELPERKGRKYIYSDASGPRRPQPQELGNRRAGQRNSGVMEQHSRGD